MKILFTIYFLTLNTIIGLGCTTFVLKNENTLVFGRNLDWVSDDGVVVVNKRNIQKTALIFPPEVATKWTSKYGSVTFNQFGKEMPFGGMNEKGLVIEIMLVTGNYPNFDSRTAVNELQWIQYQLDNAKTIDEVIESDKTIRISKINQNLHFLICDKLGNVAVIEFDKKGMHVYKGDDLPIAVLENDRYATSLRKNERNTSCRFRTASKMIEQYKGVSDTSAIEYSFKILDKVALDGSWSIVYDIKNMEIHFKTSSDRSLRKIKINDFDFNCKNGSEMYDLKRKESGSITNYFINYSSKLNTSKFDAALKSNGIQLPKSILDRFYNYNKSCECKEE